MYRALRGDERRVRGTAAPRLPPPADAAAAVEQPLLRAPVVNNILLFVDLSVATAVNLSLWRSVTALVSVSVLLFGLILESR